MSAMAAPTGPELGARPVKCAYCTYTVPNEGSMRAHVAMSHPDVPMEAIAPKRSAKTGQTVTAPAAIPPAAGAPSLREIPLDLVDVGSNVRVDVAELEELAASIAEHGVLQPVKVTQAADGRFQLVWGQRRTLAARKAGLATIPAIVQPFAEAAGGAVRSIEQLVENLHRADLNPIDRAQAMRAVVDSGVSQADLARKLGIAASTVANDLRILEAAPEIRALLGDGKLTPAHVKAVLGLEPAEQLRLAKRITDHGLSAHDVEREAKYSRDNAAQRAKDRATAERRVAEAIALLEKVASRQKTTVAVTQYGYSGDTIREALQADGWTVTTDFLETVKEPGACGCKGVWKLTFPYTDTQPVELHPACSDESHRTARNAERDAEWARIRAEGDAKRAAEKAATEARQRALGPWLATRLDTPLGKRVLLYALVVDNGSDDNLVDRYWNGDAEAYAALDDGIWTVLESVPDEDLVGLIAGAVAEVLTGWCAGDGVTAALDAAIAVEAES